MERWLILVVSVDRNTRELEEAVGARSRSSRGNDVKKKRLKQGFGCFI